MKFTDFNFHTEIQEGLDAMQFESPTPIQEKTIPITLEGKDVIGVAQTGTGKTAAFLLPVMNRIMDLERKHLNALIVVPTRELAQQIDQALEGFAYFSGITSIAIYGGGDGSEFNREKKALTTGTDIIIATPGRLISHINLGYVDFSKLDFLILDEADRMLDMGFYDDLMRIVRKCSDKRQTLLFSATMPKKILHLTKQILNNPEQVNIAISKPAEGVLQGAYVVFENQKIPLLSQLISGPDLNSIIIFSSTKKNVSVIYQKLKRKGVSVERMSSDLEQSEREKVMLAFKNRQVQVLVATDVVSRGIDIDDISLVVNYDVPGDAADYVHRVGRTARAAKTGIALSLISPDDQRKFLDIEELIGDPVRKIPVPPEFGDTPEYKPRSGNRGGGKRKFYKRNKGYKGKGNNRGSGKR